MRVTTWNIRAGGGKRIERIAQVLSEANADVIVLTEYRPKPGQRLLKLLEEFSYHVESGVPVGHQNCVCILSRYPMVPVKVALLPTSHHRWVSVHIPFLDLLVLGAHVPNQTEIWNKREFWGCVGSFAGEACLRRAMIVGDLNTALDEDCEGDPIREAVHLKKLFSAGWVDAWRAHNGEAREFSWYSHRSNGFRLDHCLVTAALAEDVLACSYRHDVREGGVSDHSLLNVDFLDRQ